MFDIQRSREVANHIIVEKRACYKNALVALLTQDSLARGRYVEGFALPDLGGCRLPMEHGWIELPNGTVVDATYVSMGITDVRYFPVLHLSRQRAARLVERGAMLPVMLNESTPGSREAYLEAQAAAYHELTPLVP